MKEYYVYLMTNHSRTLYTGVTNDLRRRVYEHKHKLVEGFTNKYNISQLVYFESTPDVRSALAREKQIKGWLRSKKTALIESMNPKWEDLSAEWFEEYTLRCAQGDNWLVILSVAKNLDANQTETLRRIAAAQKLAAHGVILNAVKNLYHDWQS